MRPVLSELAYKLLCAGENRKIDSRNVYILLALGACGHEDCRQNTAHKTTKPKCRRNSRLVQAVRDPVCSNFKSRKCSLILQSACCSRGLVWQVEVPQTICPQQL